MERIDDKIKGFPCSTKSRNVNPSGLSTFQLFQYENEDAAFLEARRLYYAENAPAEHYFPQSQATNTRYKEEFEALVKEWTSAIKYKSLESQQINHPAFLRIVAIGDKVKPFVFAEFTKRPFVAWLKALPAIVGQDVASEAESFPEAVKLWMDWARVNGYLSNDYLPK